MTSQPESWITPYRQKLIKTGQFKNKLAIAQRAVLFLAFVSFAFAVVSTWSA